MTTSSTVLIVSRSNSGRLIIVGLAMVMGAVALSQYLFGTVILDSFFFKNILSDETFETLLLSKATSMLIFR